MSVVRVLVGAAMIIAASTVGAFAEDYPTRPITIVVPFGAGGGTDILARTIAGKLPERLGQEVVIENKGGGGSAIGTVQVIKSAPDGYTLLFQSSAFTINTALYQNLPYDAIKDLAPISLLASGPVVLVAHPSTGIKSVDELIAKAKAAPNTITFATGGKGSSPHLGLVQIEASSGAKFITVHYKGSGPAITDLIGGHVNVMFAGVSQSREYIDAGKLIPLGITGDKRNPALPDVPTFKELGLPDVTAGTYWGALAPAGTPKPIIDKLSGVFAEVMHLPDIEARLKELGYVSIGSTPEEYAANIKSEIERWTKVVKEAGITPD